MIEVTRFGDVARIRMWTRRSAAAGYDVSAYMIDRVLIDTGFRHVRSDLAKVLGELSPRGCIVTHWHEDHAGNAPMLAASLPTWMAAYTEAKLRERQQVKLYRHVTWGRPNALVGAVRPLDLGRLRAIATPGHAPDHHVVFDPESATLFSGDLWLGVKVRIVGASENPYEIIDSLGRAIALRPVRMFDAHRGLVENPVAALDAKRAWLQETVGEIERRIARGDSDREILRGVLGGDELTAIVSQGEYSRGNLVRAVRRFSAARDAD